MQIGVFSFSRSISRALSLPDTSLYCSAFFACLSRELTVFCIFLLCHLTRAILPYILKLWYGCLPAELVFVTPAASSKKPSALVGLVAEYRFYHLQLDDGIGVAAHAGIHGEIDEVFQPARHFIQKVFALPDLNTRRVMVDFRVSVGRMPFVFSIVRETSYNRAVSGIVPLKITSSILSLAVVHTSALPKTQRDRRRRCLFFRNRSTYDAVTPESN